MHTALHATSKTLASYLESRFRADPILVNLFNAVTNAMVVSLNTPEEMKEQTVQGVSIWLYRIIRDDQRLNDPPVRVSPTELKPAPLPLRLHYLITPVTILAAANPANEQLLLGKVLQALHSHPVF